MSRGKKNIEFELKRGQISYNAELVWADTPELVGFAFPVGRPFALEERKPAYAIKQATGEKMTLEAKKGINIEVSASTYESALDTARRLKAFPITIQANGRACDVESDEEVVGRSRTIPHYHMSIRMENKFLPEAQEALTSVAYRQIHLNWLKNGAAPTIVEISGPKETPDERGYTSPQYVAALGNMRWGEHSRSLGRRLEIESETLGMDADNLGKRYQEIVRKPKRKGLKILGKIARWTFLPALGIGAHYGMYAPNQGSAQLLADFQAAQMSPPAELNLEQAAMMETVGNTLRWTAGIAYIAGNAAAAIYRIASHHSNKSRFGYGGGGMKEKYWSHNGWDRTMDEFNAAWTLPDLGNYVNPLRGRMVHFVPGESGRKVDV